VPTMPYMASYARKVTDLAGITRVTAQSLACETTSPLVRWPASLRDHPTELLHQTPILPPAWPQSRNSEWQKRAVPI
jgi:hypothetical protein